MQLQLHMHHVAAITTATEEEELTIKGIGKAQVKAEDRWIRLQERIASARINYALKIVETWIARFGLSLWQRNHLRIVLRTVACCK